MNFLHSELLWLLLPVLLLGAGLFLRGAYRRKKALDLLGCRPQDVILSPGKRIWRQVLLLSGAVFLLLALARPGVPGKAVIVTRKGADLLILFDLSKSMLATDVAPSRLAHAAFLTKELINHSGELRFALVPFAGTAYPASPFTDDRETLTGFIDELDPETMPRGGTDFEQALTVAEKLLNHAAGQRAVLLITDGEELEGNYSSKLAGLKKNHTAVFAVGLGSPEGMVLTDAKGRPRRDDAGKVITTRLNETLLKKLAAETGGAYHHASVTDRDFGEVSRRIRQLDTAAPRSKKYEVRNEYFPYCIAAALLCLFAVGFSGEAPRRKRSRNLVLFVLVNFAGITLFGADSPETEYNAARQEQLKGGKELAKRYGEVMSRSSNPELLAKSLFNTAVLRHNELRAAGKSASLDKIPELKSNFAETGKLYLESAALNRNSGFLPAVENYLAELDKDLQDLKKREEMLRKLEEQRHLAQQSAESALQQQKRNQNNQNNRAGAEQAARQAGQAAEKLEKSAGQQQEKNLQQRSSQAVSAIHRALKEQQKSGAEAAKKAEENLAKAVQLLKPEAQNKPDQDKKQNQSNAGKNGKQNQSGEKKQMQNSGKTEKNDKARQEQLAQTLKELDKQGKEKYKAIQRQRYRRNPVERDW